MELQPVSIADEETGQEYQRWAVEGRQIVTSGQTRPLGQEGRPTSEW